MKLEPNMYVRYKYEEIVFIGKITFISEVMCGLDETLQIDIDNCMEEILKKDIIKASHNIIDLIQSKDLIVDTKNNLYVVDRVEGDYVFTTSKNEYGLIITLVDYQIKSIVTKEQFESMSYKVD